MAAPWAPSSRSKIGGWSNQRHWHTEADEFVYVLRGEVTLISDDGAEVLAAGDAAGFKAGGGDGHCLRITAVRLP